MISTNNNKVNIVGLHNNIKINLEPSTWRGDQVGVKGGCSVG